MDRNLLNIIFLGFGFMFLFTAFQTMGNIEQTVIDSIKTDDPTFTGDGYTSLSIIYAVLSICNWLVPSIITKTGPRGAMVIGGTTYCLFMVSFLWPQGWLLYVCSAILGAGAALIWIGQGAYIARCSNPETISRNTGVCWAIFQLSMFFGNLFVFFQFQGLKHIDQSTRTIVFSVLIGVAIVGLVILALLRYVPPVKDEADLQNDSQDSSDSSSSSEEENPIKAFKNAVRLFFTKDFLLLSIAFVYTGFELSFYSGVYSTSIGFTDKLGVNAKQLVGLSGIFIGVGEVLGGVLFGILGSKTIRYGRDPIVISGFVIHLISFFLIYMNLPNGAPLGNTSDLSVFDPPMAWLAILCSFLLGFGDACFNTQIYSMLAGSFAKNSVAAFSIFKFTQSVAAAIGFVYSSQTGLRYQIGILVVFSIIGTFCFCLVEWAIKRKNNLNTIETASETEDYKDKDMIE
uniref:UNC93-like protein MFSD11 n=1 Tax=Corethrella appendiculata TaxID=1370023 RepID=U5EXR4_9DIPT